MNNVPGIESDESVNVIWLSMLIDCLKAGLKFFAG